MGFSEPGFAALVEQWTWIRCGSPVSWLRSPSGEGDPQPSLCAASAEVMNVSGAGVVLILRGRTLGTVCVSDAVTETVEDVQYTLGRRARASTRSTTKAPVLVPDLDGFDVDAVARVSRGCAGRPASGPSSASRCWSGPVCIGALNLYHDQIGT